MRNFVTFAVAVLLTMTTAFGQTPSERQKGLAACACLMDWGDLVRLEPVSDEQYSNI